MVEEVAYRTVREAVSNVRRHARARRLEIQIAATGGMLRGSIRDDGRGFDPSRVGRRSHGVRLHLGIETLLERAELAGGTATVDSKPGQGTAVTFELPLSGAPLAES
jgi:signal transduction histidine kinase